MEQTKNEIELQTKIQKWNREKSVAKMQKKIGQWKTLTVEIARELFLAHQNLTGQQGQHTNPDADNFIAYTWGNYCEDIGIQPRTAHNWLKRFIPAELSQTGENTLLSPEEFRQTEEAKQIEEAKGQTARIQLYLKTGIRPDYFQEILEISTRKRAKRLALETPEQNIIQEKTFLALDQYLCQFQDYQTRLIAAVNLQERLKQVVNVYAEEEILKAEQEDAEELRDE